MDAWVSCFPSSPRGRGLVSSTWGHVSGDATEESVCCLRYTVRSVMDVPDALHVCASSTWLTP